MTSKEWKAAKMNKSKYKAVNDCTKFRKMLLKSKGEGKKLMITMLRKLNVKVKQKVKVKPEN